ncbi:hypothetical protein pb186bvf_010625 [Paramecium bursaria]
MNRGRSVRPQLQITSPQRAVSPVVFRPVNEAQVQLQMDKVLMGLEIQRLNRVLLELDKRNRSQCETLLIEIQNLRSQLQQQEDSKLLLLQKDAQIDDLNRVIISIAAERNQLTQHLQQLSQQLEGDPISVNDHHIGQLISDIEQDLIQVRSNPKYVEQTKCFIQLSKMHLQALEQIPSRETISNTQQINVFLTKIKTDLEMMLFEGSPRRSPRKSPYRQHSPSLRSEEVFMKILNHIEYLQKDSNNVPTMIKQISLLNQLVRLKNEDLKMKGSQKIVITHSPRHYSTGRKLNGSVRVITPTKFSPIRISPLRVSPLGYSVPQRHSFQYPQRVLIESNSQKLNQTQPQNQVIANNESQTLTAQQGQIIQMEVLMREMEQQLLAERNHNDQLKKQIDQLLREIEGKNQEIIRLNQPQEDDRNSRQQSFASENLSLKRQLNNKQLELQNSQITNGRLEQKVDSLQKEINILSDQKQELYQTIEKQSQQIQQLNKHLDDVQNQLEVLDPSFQRIVQQEPSEVGKLKKELDDLKKQLQKKEPQVSEFQIEPTDELRVLKIQYIDKSNECEVLKTEKQLLNQKLAFAEQKLQDLQKMIQENQNQLSQLYDSIGIKDKSLLDLNQTNQNNQQQLQLLGTQLQHEQSLILQKDQELQQWKQKYTQLLENDQAKIIKDRDQQIEQLNNALVMEQNKSKNIQQIQIQDMENRENETQYSGIVQIDQQTITSQIQANVQQFASMAPGLELSEEDFAIQLQIMEANPVFQQAIDQKMVDFQSGFEQQINDLQQQLAQNNENVWKAKYEDLLGQIGQGQDVLDKQKLLGDVQSLQQQNNILQQDNLQVQQIEKDNQNLRQSLNDALSQLEQLKKQVNIQVPQIEPQQGIQFGQDPQAQIKISQLEQQIQNLKNQIQDQEKQIQEDQKTFKDALNQNDQQRIIADLMQKNADAKQQLRENGQNLSIQLQENINLQNKIAQLQQPLVQQALPNLIAEQLEKDNQKLQNQVDAVKQQLLLSQEQYENLLLDNNKKQQQIDIQVQQAQLLQDKVYEKEQELLTQLPLLNQQIEQKQLQLQQQQNEQQLWQEKDQQVSGLSQDQQQMLIEAQQEKQFWKAKYDDFVQLSQAQLPTSGLQQKVLELQNKLNQLEYDNKQLQKFQNDNKQLQEERIMNEELIAQNQNKINSLDQALNLEREQIASLKQTINEQKAREEALVIQNAELQNQTQNKQDSIWKAQYESLLSQQQPQEKQQAIQQVDLRPLEDQINSLQEQLNIANQENQNLQQALGELNNDQQQIQGYLDQIQQLNDQVIQLQQQQIQEQQPQSSKFLQFSQDPQKVLKITQQEQQIQLLQSQIADIQRQRADDQQIFKEAMQQVDKEGAIVKLMQKNQEVQSNLRDKEAKLQQQQQQNIGYQSQITKLNQALLESQDPIIQQGFNDKLQNLDIENQKLQKNIDHWKEKYQQLFDQVSVQHSPTSLQQQLLQKTQQIHQLEEQVNDQQIVIEAQIPLLQSQLEQKDKDIVQRQNEANIWHDRYEDLVKQRLDQGIQLQKDIQQAQEQSDFWKVKYDELLNQKLQELPHDSIQKQLLEEQNKSVQFEGENKILSQQLQDINIQGQKDQQLLQEQLQTLEQQNQDLQQKLQLEAQQVIDQRQTISMLQNKDQQYQKDIAELKSVQDPSGIWKAKYQELLQNINQGQGPLQQIQDYEGRLVERLNDINSLQSQVQQLREKQQIQDQVMEDNQQLKIDLQAAQKLQEKLMDDVNSYQQQVIELKQKSQIQQQEPIQFQQDPNQALKLVQQDQQIQLLQAQLREIEQQRKEDQKLTQEALKQGDPQGVVAELMQKNQAAQTQNRDLQQQLQISQQNNIGLQSQLTKTNQQVIELQQQQNIQQLNDQIKQLQVENTQQGKQIEHWKQKYQELLDHTSQQYSPTNLNNQLLQQIQKNHELEEQIHLEQAKYETEVPVLDGKIVELENKLDQQRKDTDFWHSKYEDTILQKQDELQKIILGENIQTEEWNPQMELQIMDELQNMSEEQLQQTYVIQAKKVYQLEATTVQFQQEMEDIKLQHERRIEDVQTKVRDQQLVLNDVETQLEIEKQQNADYKLAIQDYQDKEQKYIDQITQLNKESQQEQQQPKQEIIQQQPITQNNFEQERQQLNDIIKSLQEQVNLQKVQMQNAEQVQQDLNKQKQQNQILLQQAQQLSSELAQAQQKIIQVPEQQQQDPIKFQQDPEKVLQITQLEQQNLSLQKQMKEMESQHEQDKRLYQDALTSTDKEGVLAQAMQRNQDIQLQNRELSKQLEQTQQDSIGLQSQIVKLNNQIIELQNQQSLNDLKAQLNQAQLERDQQAKLVEHWKQKYQEILEQVSAQHSPNSLQQQLLINTQKLHELEEDLHMKQIQLDQLPQMDAQRQSMAVELQQQQQETALWHDRYEDIVRARISQQDIEAQSVIQQVQDLSPNTIKNKYVQAVNLNQKLQQKNQQVQDQIAVLEKEQQNLQEFNINLQNQHNQLNQQYILSQDQVNDLQTTVAQLQIQQAEQLRQIQEGGRPIQQDVWKNKYEELIQQIDNDKIKQQQRETESTQAARDSSQFQEQILTLQNQIQNLQGQIKDLQIYQQDNLVLQNDKNNILEQQKQLLQQIDELQRERIVQGEPLQKQSSIQFNQDPQKVLKITQLEQQNILLLKQIDEVQKQRKDDQVLFQEALTQDKESTIVKLMAKNQEQQTQSREIQQKLEASLQENISILGQVTKLNQTVIQLQDGQELKQSLQLNEQQKEEILKLNKQLEHWKQQYQQLLETSSQQYSPTSAQQQILQKQQQLAQSEEKVHEQSVVIENTLPRLEAQISFLENQLDQKTKEAKLWSDKYEDLIDLRQSFVPQEQISQQQIIQQSEDLSPNSIKQQFIEKSLQLAQLQEKYNQLLGEFQIVHEEVKQMDQLKDDLHELQVQNNEQQQILNINDKQVEVLNQKISELQAKEFEYQEQIKQHLNVIGQQDLGSMRQIQIIESQKSLLKEQSEQSSPQKDPSDLLDQIERLKQKIQQQEEQIGLKDDKDERIADLQNKLNQSRQQQTELMDDVNKYQQQVIQLKSELPEQQQIQFEQDPQKALKIVQLEQQNILLQKQIDEIQKQRQEDQKVVQDTLSGVDKEGIIAQLIQKNQDSQTQNRDLQQRLEQSQQESIGVLSQLRKANEQIIQFQDQHQIQELEDQIQKLNTQSQQQQKSVEHWKQKYQELLDHTSQQYSPTNLNNQLLQRTQQVHDLEEQLQNKQVQIENDIPQLESRCYKLTQELTQQRMETNLWHNKYEELIQNRQVQATDDVKDLQFQVVEAEKQAQFWNLQYDQLFEQSKADLSPTSIKAQLLDQAKKISTLEFQLEQQSEPQQIQQIENTQIVQLNKQIDIVQSQVDFYKQQYEQQKDQRQKQQVDLIEQQNEVKKYQDKEQELQLQIQKLKKDKQDADQQLIDLLKQNQARKKSSSEEIVQSEIQPAAAAQEAQIQFWKNKCQELLQVQQRDAQKVKDMMALNEQIAQSIAPVKKDDIIQLKLENEKLLSEVTFYQKQIKEKGESADFGSQGDTFQSQVQEINKLNQKLKEAQEQEQYWHAKYQEIAEQNIQRETSLDQDPQNSASYWRQRHDEAVSALQQNIMQLQQQLAEKEEQLENHMQSFQSILKDELKEELIRIRQQEPQQGQMLQRMIDQHEQEKQELIVQYQKRIDQLQQSNVQKYPEGEEWKELILKFEKHRQNELLELRQHLEILQRQQISTQEIEFYAERRAYENTINQLRNQQSQDDELIDTIEFLRNQNLEFQEQVSYLQNERNTLEYHIIQQNQTIDQLKDQLARSQQQQAEYRRRQRVDVVEAIDQMRRDRESYVMRSPARHRQTQRETQRGGEGMREGPRGSFDRYSQPREQLRQSNYQYSSPRMTQYQPPQQSENKDIVQKLQELEEVKHKYQIAMNNLVRLEAQVLEKIFFMVLIRI